MKTSVKDNCTFFFGSSLNFYCREKRFFKRNVMFFYFSILKSFVKKIDEFII